MDDEHAPADAWSRSRQDAAVQGRIVAQIYAASERLFPGGETAAEIADDGFPFRLAEPINLFLIRQMRKAKGYMTGPYGWVDKPDAGDFRICLSKNGRE